MSVETNKALVRRYIEDVWNQKQLDSAAQYLSPGYIRHNDVIPAGQATGIQALQRIVEGDQFSFPDQHLAIEQIIGEGEIVAALITMSITHEQEFMGIPATGKHAAFRMSHFFRIADGMIAEEWVTVNPFELFRQLEILPAMADVLAQQRS